MTYHEVRENHHPDEGGGRNLPSIKLVALLVVAVAIIVFFFQNTDSVEVEFLWMDVNWPVRSVILISLVAGMIIARLGSFFWNRARRRKNERDD
ncbi:MAG: LapA family protein [Ilumatobacter fluminis]|uniref:Uncharacterized protein DUF1049 n=1 Tax=Ilumatobacter fluminis TaxID=467091 RepID=A0A4R7HYH4_9ACTN|nr:LapA family protein [Ilumatobacter fluminis]TDT16151.1 uncharacterized protein DUF1049 [Ilumatobacter fluminis]